MEPETPTYWMSMLLLVGFILILFAAFIGFARADYDNTPPPVCTMVCSPNGLVCVTQCY